VGKIVATSLQSKTTQNRVKRLDMQDTMITTSSATVGGLTKAFVLGFAQPTITFPQILEVSIYAAISATIGYSVKMMFDLLKDRIQNRKAKIHENNNEELNGEQYEASSVNTNSPKN